MEFEPAGGERRSKVRVVKLSHENGSNTGRLTERQRRIVDGLFVRWGLLPAEPPSPALAAQAAE